MAQQLLLQVLMPSNSVTTEVQPWLPRLVEAEVQGVLGLHGLAGSGLVLKYMIWQVGKLSPELVWYKT